MNLRTAAGYAVGDFGINLYFISVMTYLLYFYTDVLDISAVAAGSVFAVARFIDAVTDPVMGAIAVGFLSFSLFTSNPFARLLPGVPADGNAQPSLTVAIDEIPA